MLLLTATSPLSGTESKGMLESLLGPDVYDCDAYICLWRLADTLALYDETRHLAMEYRFKSLDAEMWRSLLKEENLARQHGLEDDEDDEMDEEDGDKADDDHHQSGDEEMTQAMDVEDEASVAGHSHHTTVTGATGTQITGASTTVTTSTPNQNSTCPGSPLGSSSDKLAKEIGMNGSPCAEKNSSLQTIAANSTPLADDWRAWGPNGADGEDDDDEDDDEEEEGSHAGPDASMYADYFSKRRHQYRNVVSEAFRSKVMVCLKEIDLPDATPTLLARSRPLLHRIMMLLPMADIPTILQIVATKFSYEEALHLLTPLLVETEEGRVMSLITISRAMDWAISYGKGRGLALITRLHLGLIDSAPLLQRMARRAALYGREAMPFILRSLTAVPPRIYELEAMELAKLMGENWPKEALVEYGHVLIVRSLQRQPSLSLYFALKKHVLPDSAGVQRVLEHMDPSGDLSIGIRLAEGLTVSALDSLSYSLISTTDGKGAERAFFWFSFTVQGLKEDRLSADVLSQLIANENFKNAVFGGLAVEGNEETKCRQLLVSCFTKLHELAANHPEVVVSACQLLLSHYSRFENHRRSDSSMLSAVGNVLKAAGKTSSFLGDMMKSLYGTPSEVMVDVMAS